MRIAWIGRGSRDGLPLGALLEELPSRLTRLGQHTVVSPAGALRWTGRSSASRRRIEVVPVSPTSVESLTRRLQPFRPMTMVTLGKLKADELAVLAALDAPWIVFQPWEADGQSVLDGAAPTGCTGLVFTSEAAAHQTRDSGVPVHVIPWPASRHSLLTDAERRASRRRWRAD